MKNTVHGWVRVFPDILILFTYTLGPSLIFMTILINLSSGISLNCGFISMKEYPSPSASSLIISIAIKIPFVLFLIYNFYTFVG